MRTLNGLCLRSLGISLLLIAGHWSPAEANPIMASVFLDGGDFLQSGSLTNMSSLNVVGLSYSLGIAEPGGATWEIFNEAPIGTRRDFLSDGRHYQTFQWSNLSIPPGGAFSFTGFDIDYIVSLTPLDISGAVIDASGESLRNAFVSATMEDGTVLTGHLLQTGWRNNQRISLSAAPVATPEPATLLLMAGGLGACLRMRRRHVRTGE